MSFIENLLVFLIQTLIEIPLIWTGEIVLFVATFGRHQPRWDAYTHEGGSDFVFLSELSFWIGFITLIAVGLCIKAVFFSTLS